ncbi:MULTISPECIES: NAD(P)-binding domain-containing protein [Xanthomonas]|uniref:NADPH-dependent F420 reductase n=1 Tax=Xanthomonas TaxID=338 RepID=UPI001F497598|nr:MULTISPECIES: NAD(P)-binding domain-containing protein [Xanthomonas]
MCRAVRSRGQSRRLHDHQDQSRTTDVTPTRGSIAMKIGILGTGFMGRVLARKLAAAGHDVKVANSRGPGSIAEEILETGAHAATAEEALQDVDVVILAMPHPGFEKIRHLVAGLPEQTTVIDISNYFPGRDPVNPELDGDKAESEWVRDYFGRPIAKAWNSIGMLSFEINGRGKGEQGRIALPVSADRPQDQEIALRLVEDTGFDGFYAGCLADSWRQQPGSPVYITDLTFDEMGPALASAERDRLPKRRDLSAQVFAERVGERASPDAETVVKIARALFI